MDFLSGLIIGVIIIVVFYFLFRKKLSNKMSAKQQSSILLEKIRNVSKLITIESDFSEILHHQASKNILLKLFKSDKKAIVMANSKVMVGFDMKKIKIEPKPNKKTLVLTHFPQPEVLGIETNIEYYDVTNGWFNKFDAQDLTNINQEVRKNIEQKIPDSGLLASAQEKALETVNMIEQIVGTFGWSLDYKQWNLPETPQIKKIKAKN